MSINRVAQIQVISVSVSIELLPSQGKTNLIVDVVWLQDFSLKLFVRAEHFLSKFRHVLLLLHKFIVLLVGTGDVFVDRVKHLVGKFDIVDIFVALFCVDQANVGSTCAGAVLEKSDGLEHIVTVCGVLGAIKWVTSLTRILAEVALLVVHGWIGHGVVLQGIVSEGEDQRDGQQVVANPSDGHGEGKAAGRADG